MPPSIADLLPPETEGTKPISDSRGMSFARLGERDGPVVVVLDGPGSRGLARAAAGAAESLGLTLIAPDRPGFGGSPSGGEQTIADVCRDLLALVDALGVRRFGILGQSGGTPYSLGLAAAAGDRCTGVALTGAVIPLGEPDALDDVSGPMKPLFKVARRAPWLLRPLLSMAARQTRRDPAAAAKRYAQDLPDADRRILENPRMWAIHEKTSGEAISQPAAFATEVRRLTRPWDLDLTTLTAPVALWAGERDGTHPPSMSRRLAERLGGAPITLLPGASTFGLSAAYPAALRHAAALPAGDVREPATA
jgi:pimeloyl-ACP methyl ester carboxylesterase